VLFRCIAFICLLSIGPCCYAQAVTIRIINANDGSPLRDQKVSVSLLYDKGEAQPANYNGHFVLPGPAPTHISAQVRLAPSHWRCGCGVLIATEELIRKGTVGPLPAADSGKSAASVKTAPGEILFVARPLSFWERLLYPFVKG
jgi:hypothetical protein